MGAQNWTHLLPRASPWPWGCLPGGPSWGKQSMSKGLLVLNSLPHFQSLESGAIPANALEHWPPMVPFDSLDPQVPGWLFQFTAAQSQGGGVRPCLGPQPGMSMLVVPPWAQERPNNGLEGIQLGCSLPEPSSCL